mmetsp:Transcript_18949/g.56285  ORF Transcript_18949/g.56285 Transcript_18949/m.56285 type:complete len:233 (-) Transcript_18949:418-1116(-)
MRSMDRGRSELPEGRVGARGRGRQLERPEHEPALVDHVAVQGREVLREGLALGVDVVEVAVDVRLARRHDGRGPEVRVDVADDQGPARLEQPQALLEDLPPRRRGRLVQQEEDRGDVRRRARQARALRVAPPVGDVEAEVEGRPREVPGRAQHLGARVHGHDPPAVALAQRARRRARARAQVHGPPHLRRVVLPPDRVEAVEGRAARVDAAVGEGVEAQREQGRHRSVERAH